MGFAGIDLNMGCPVPNVADRGKGSGLILRPEVAGELIQAAKAGGLPVSVKTRLGFTELSEMQAWISHLLKQDIANLSVHLRTRKEMSKAAAHWELIPELVKLRDAIAPETLLTINGDIPDRKTGEELAEKYGVDGIMIGRGILKILMRLKSSLKSTRPKSYCSYCACSWTYKISIKNNCLAPSSASIAFSRFMSKASREPMTCAFA